jgi:hypothetical protein
VKNWFAVVSCGKSVCDAGCDPDYRFADLGNALRKIWIDLGVRIDMTGLDQLKKRFTERPTPATPGPYWATGHIRYPEANDDKARWGRLLYLKAGLHGTEPMDVLSYAIAHPENLGLYEMVRRRVRHPPAQSNVEQRHQHRQAGRRGITHRWARRRARYRHGGADANPAGSAERRLAG